MTPDTSSTLQPGLCILHGNRLEDLTDAVVQWVRDNPLGPLEDELFLVQSNGMAQWLKLALAADDACGISAAQDFQMPARFLWQAYRLVLGREAVPETSPFDKSRLQWRLMRLLPELKDQKEFAPLQRFLKDDQDQRKRHQLAERLADLFDQYQVYRADWLDAWENGDDRIFRGNQSMALDESRWQAMLWRRILEDMDEDEAGTSRASIHQRFMEALAAGETHEALPRRIIVFGLSSLPQQALEALHALSPHCQILMMVPNPCRHYWADIIEHRELLRREQKRHQQREHLARIDPALQHREANPLLAAWGKQGRDYIGLLYDYDVPEDYRDWFNEIDIFEPPGTMHPDPDSLLAQVQHNIWDLEPVPAEPQRRQPDDSIVFHLAHSPQREVEILHDRLLAAFEQSAQKGEPLRPRDVIVMVPDIETYAPHIEAVFGNIGPEDRRHIPYTISDRSQRHTRPTAIALERLLELPRLRFTLSDLLDLLEVPALRRRFDISEGDVPLLRDWARGAGIRWGLHGEQRASMALPEGLEQNTWWFGVKRMLLGYAAGSGDAWQDIEPHDEVGGLKAVVAGRLVELLETLEHHWRILQTPATPQQWGQRLRALMEDFLVLDEQEDLALQASLLETLENWQQACGEAGLDDPLELTVVREAWLGALDESSLSQRFLAGRVNFCTLMPMRSIPFRHVCLLGMNDRDYPRSQTPQDFDLMALRGQYRPGDRSRRDDDRYLFLEAVLAAREQLYVSWVGRDLRDNEVRPPSVLVAQLRDYLDAVWTTETKGSTKNDGSMAGALTLAHPLQPFSPVYFPKEDDRKTPSPYFSYAGEWRAVHERKQATENQRLSEPALDQPVTLSPDQLARFLKNPTGHFFSNRLNVYFNEEEGAEEESEPFTLDGLERWQAGQSLIEAGLRASPEERESAFEEARERLRRAGMLPAGAFGEQQLEDIAEPAWQALQAWWALCEDYPEEAPVQELYLKETAAGHELVLEHWLSNLRGENGKGKLQAQIVPGKIRNRPDKDLDLWSRHLLACACGKPIESRLVAADAVHVLKPVPAEQAAELLGDLLEGWFEGLCRPLPLAARTGFVWLTASERADPWKKARNQYESGFANTGEVDYGNNEALKRAWPDFAALCSQATEGTPDFARWAIRLYQPLLEHRDEVPHE